MDLKRRYIEMARMNHHHHIPALIFQELVTNENERSSETRSKVDDEQSQQLVSVVDVKRQVLQKNLQNTNEGSQKY